eukprot:4454026-Pleurochrysis_carterae.AAC.1
MVLPIDTIHVCKRIQGYAVNTYRLETIGRNSAKSGSMVSIDLPSNSIVDLHSFIVHGKTNFKANVSKGTRLPSDTRLLVNRVEVSCGGSNLDSTSSRISRVQQALNIVDCKRSASAKGVYRNYNHTSGKVIPADANETDMEIVITDLPGFLSGTSRFLDTSLLPDVRISLHINSPDVFSTCGSVDVTAYAAVSSNVPGAPSGGFATENAAKAVDFELTDVYATVKCIQFADGELYNSMITSLMQSSMGALEIPFKSYYVVEDSHTATTRTSVSTQSLDRVFALWPTNMGSVGTACKPIAGYNGGFHTPGSAFDSELYQGGYEVTSAGDFDTLRAQFRVNNCAFPQWEASLRDWYEMLPSKHCATTFAQF